MPDTTAGDGPLKRYWTQGAGLAQWISSPHPWTTLRDLLAKHISVEYANRVAASWFREVMGFWPGDRKGHNPTGPG